MENKTYPPQYLSWIVWGLGAAFYLSGFFQRVAPAVMTDHLMADFQIGAAALGNLSAFYFYSYVAMQIPTGILADSWGPRKLLTAGSLVASLGAFLFALAPTIFLAGLGRLMIGAAVGVAWVAMLKLSAHWIAPNRFAMTSGLGLFFGIMGAVSAGVPLRILVDTYGWRPVMLVSAALVLVLTALIWFIVRDDPEEKGFMTYAPSTNGGNGSPSSMLAGLLRVFYYRNTWFLTIAPGGVVGPALAFSGLWGVPFLSTHYGMSPAHSAAITSTLLVAWAVGGPVLGALSDRIGYRKPICLAGNIISCAGWSIVLFVPHIPIWLLTTLAAIIGFASGGIIISFAFAKESVPPSLGGTVSGVCNMGFMTGPMVLQPVMGWILDGKWKGVMENGTRIYDLAAYQSAFTVMICWSVLSVIMIYFTSETRCRQIVGD